MPIPNLTPLQQWICDTCGQVILEPDHGYAEIVADSDDMLTEFRIQHHAPHSPLKNGCLLPTGAAIYHNHLNYYLGPDGMTVILGYIDQGAHNQDVAASRVHPQHMRDWADFMRRVQLPYFEESRFYLPQATSDGYIDSHEHRPYLQEMMQFMIDKYGAGSDFDSES